MLSISARTSAASATSYYAHLQADNAPEDYYTKEGDAGRWLGAGAVALGLTGAVNAADFQALAEGRRPGGGDLVRGAGEKHRAGWDLTFSAPKSVSATWAVADAETRDAIQAAHARAVERALAHVQEHAITARRGHGGHEHERAEMVAALFDHGTSRAQDPALHTHAFVMNCAARDDGTWGGIESRHLFQWKMAAGAIYRSELAAELQALGFETERDKTAFRVADVPRAVEREFSQRRQAIESALTDRCASSAKASEIAALDTRSAKEIRSRDELHTEWTGRASEIDRQWVESLQSQLDREPVIAHESLPAPAVLLREITESASTFTEQQLWTAVAQRAQGVTDSAGIRSHVERVLDDPELVKLRGPDGSIRYTSREMRELEEGIADGARRRQHEPGHQISVDAIERAAASRTLSDEQRVMLEHVTGGQGVAAVQGMAGTGKSYSLGAAREAWESAGFTVTGASLAGKAAAGLEEGSGIKSQTLHSLIAQLDRGDRQLTKRDVVVIDEAGMIGSRQMSMIMQHTEQAGAKLVLVGDSAQLQPIDAGAPHRVIADTVGAAGLTEIRRQTNEADRQAVHALASGRAGEALAHYRAEGRLHSADTHRDLMTDMLDRWAAERDVEKPGESLLVAATRSEVRELNLRAREQMRAEHRLGPSAEVRGREFAEGDRIIVDSPHKETGLNTGQLGTLQRLDLNRRGDWIATVMMDDGSTHRTRLSNDAEDWRGLQINHGYAMTVHRAQGVTVDQVYALVSETMSDREWGYVASSRSRQTPHVYAPQDMTDDLERILSRSRQAESSTDYEVVPREPGPCEHKREAEVEL